jgi:hypothetical protein
MKVTERESKSNSGKKINSDIDREIKRSSDNRAQATVPLRPGPDSDGCCSYCVSC